MSELSDIFSESIRTPRGHADVLIQSAQPDEPKKDTRPVLHFSLTPTGKRVITRSEDEG